FGCHACHLVRRGTELHDRAAANHFRSERANQLGRFFDGLSAANDVVNDDARVDLALIDVLAKHALSLFLLCPINLFGAQRVTDTEGYGNSTGTGTDNRYFGEPARDVSIETKLSAKRDREHASCVVIAKREGHLKIVW